METIRNKRTLFIHHSTGANLLSEGYVRKELAKKNPQVELWDHSYNLYPVLPKFLARFTHHKGLSDNAGKITGKDFHIVLSNNSPKEYMEIFSRRDSNPTLKAILDFDVIAFKNCYPTTKITSYQQLELYKEYYLHIRDSLARYPKNKFILITPPPLRRELTEKEYAHRAQKLVDWLTAPTFLPKKTNLFVFDLFHFLADKNGYLKKQYSRRRPFDSHPNKQANREVGKVFAAYLANIASSI